MNVIVVGGVVWVRVCVYLRMCVRMSDYYFFGLCCGGWGWVGAARAGYATVEHPRL